METIAHALVDTLASFGTYGSAALFVLALGAQVVARAFIARSNRARDVLRVEQRASDRPLRADANASGAWENETRIFEARAVVRSYQQIARWHHYEANLLTFGQYVIGGVLATSFAQDALSATLVGVLGVLVLLSSLIHQQYRPDIRARNGHARAIALRQTVRKAEDLLFQIRQAASKQVESQVTLQDVRGLVSEALDAADISELTDYEVANPMSARLTATTSGHFAAPVVHQVHPPTSPLPSPLPLVERAGPGELPFER